MPPRSTKKNAIPELSASEYQELHALADNSLFFTGLESRHNIKLSGHDRSSIGVLLLTYAHAVFDGERSSHQRQNSQDEIVRTLDGLLNAIDKQRSLPVWSPGREGYESFVLESQKNGESYPEYRRDRFDDVCDPSGGHWSSLMDRQGWLESHLRKIRETLALRPLEATRRGPKGKAKYRTYVIYELAQIFDRSGGSIKAYKNPGTGRIDGAFVRFVIDLLGACPKTFRGYLGTGIADAILKWNEGGRKPPSEGLMSLPLL